VTRGRITFPGNPWPDGHAIKTAAWTAVLEPAGLRFHLHVVSADYYADDDDDDYDSEPDDAWKARNVWSNYHACILSSTHWGDDGFLAATPGKPIDLDKLAGKTFRVERVAGKQLPERGDERAFGIYLLGHDTATDHRIELVKRRGPWTYDVRWRARIALTYVGNTRLEHRLDATLPKLSLERIAMSDELTPAEARELAPRVIAGGARLRTTRRGFRRPRR
jgi:hypothetical protein